MARNPLLKGLRPVHPGELLREDVLPALGLPKAQIARLLGVSRKTLYDLLDEKQGVSAGMALRLGKLCGDGGNIWLNMQRQYDMQIAETELADQIAAIPTLTARDAA
jgi:addiction module HigA family antidote